MICRYLNSSWAEVFERSGMTEQKVIAIWRERRKAVKAAFGPEGFKKQMSMHSGLDNPYATKLAWKVMMNAASRGRAVKIASRNKSQRIAA